MSDPQIDVGVVLQKLQNKLGEAYTTIAVLEARIEQLQQPPVDVPDTPSSDVPPATGPIVSQPAGSDL